MLGTFRDGDRLRMEPITLSALSPGDVVVFHRRVDWKPEPQRIVHRVGAGSVWANAWKKGIWPLLPSADYV